MKGFDNIANFNFNYNKRVKYFYIHILQIFTCQTMQLLYWQLVNRI